MPSSKKLRLGGGALVTIKATSVHPGKIIRDACPNKNPNKQITGIVLRREDKIIRKKTHHALSFNAMKS